MGILLKQLLRISARKCLMLGLLCEVVFIIAMAVHNTKAVCVVAAICSIGLYFVGLIVSLKNGFILSSMEISSAIGCVLQLIYLRWLNLHGNKPFNCWIETWAGFTVFYQFIQIVCDAYLKKRNPRIPSLRNLVIMLATRFLRRDILPRFSTRATGGVRTHFGQRSASVHRLKLTVCKPFIFKTTERAEKKKRLALIATQAVASTSY